MTGLPTYLVEFCSFWDAHLSTGLRRSVYSSSLVVGKASCWEMEMQLQWVLASWEHRAVAPWFTSFMQIHWCTVGLEGMPWAVTSWLCGEQFTRMLGNARSSSLLKINNPFVFTPPVTWQFQILSALLVRSLISHLRCSYSSFMLNLNWTPRGNQDTWYMQCLRWSVIALRELPKRSAQWTKVFGEGWCPYSCGRTFFHIIKTGL